MSQHITAFVFALIGGLIQEFLHRQDLVASLEAKKYQRLVRAKKYWFLVISNIVVSAIGTMIWFFDEPQSARTYLLTGVAFPIIFKKAVATIKHNKKGTNLGDEVSSWDYF